MALPSPVGCRLRRALTVLIAIALLASTGRSDDKVSTLSPENLLLIVNSNEPAGQRLAEFYARQRKLPDGRILAVPLPKADELTRSAFEDEVAPAVRKFLQDNKLEEKVTCLVTFYGVPLRVGPRINTAAETGEYKVIDTQLSKELTDAQAAVKTVEDIALQAKPDFKPPTTSQEMPALPVRADAAVRVILDALATDGDADRRSQRFSRLMAAIEKLYGPLETQERLALPAYQRFATRPITPEQQADGRRKTQALILEVQALNARTASDADARTRLRELFATNLGHLRTLQVLSEQKLRLETRETHAAFDSELACLWWPTTMLRYRWHENPLYHRIRFPVQSSTNPANPASRMPRTLMVARLDAPTEELVRQIITTSIATERQGLTGVVALDARGKTGGDAYSKFDDLIRSLASELRERSRAEVKLDDTDNVFPPDSVQNVALYCGWYSLRNYVPGMQFNDGAVGYHVASGEMISLHHPTERGWSANLLKAGVVATLGPVAEPYLHSFPQPTEFFPLLMTGKLTLAEVYWLTNPLVSWMNTLVGDPLYTPYKKNPPYKSTDVSHRLRAIFAEADAASTGQ